MVYDPESASRMFGGDYERSDIGAAYRQFRQQHPSLSQTELVRLFNQQYRPQALSR